MEPYLNALEATLAGVIYDTGDGGESHRRTNGEQIELMGRGNVAMGRGNVRGVCASAHL